MTTRRSFLTASLSALGATALPAIEPIKRAGKSRMQLGVAAYSFRERFQWMRGKEQKAKEGQKPWSILDFIDWCADNNVPGAEVTSYFFPPDVDEKYLLEVKRHAYLRGVQLAGTAVGNNFALPKGEKLDQEIADVKRWIDYSAIMSAPHIRVFAGPQPKGLSEEEAVANCQAAYQECLDYAAKKGVFLGLENHGGIVAEPENLIKMVKAANSPWAGINFDSGNFHTEDPYADLAKIAPYSVNVQLKMEISRKGAAKGEHEPSDVDRVLKILREANYQGWFTLEYEVKNTDPLVEVPKILEMLRPKLA
ncbi:sugar phosphate isomerase/epimerase family protein [Prosthecobacter dejongeii]|uniref:Sugar phosphate isomerase/epimerase n=1 Tax=Prosthecobacter dejongeii TaxID=48465 RepID=A0A7W7YI06_9BACT|nr:sugar phosphate isomerase/epimerase family protein [Prosthecobacter dejongeii]MBB5036580.1 sugar phosphate isomerase/epimerase [Prosthecobacter dejongeii]